MAYHCKHCNFRWNAWEDDFQKVLVHEKTHLENNKLKTLRVKIK